ncbi:MAG: component of SufBCD complex [Pseudomonadota bacterium]
MSLEQSVFELIDMRSFSNLWYWIGLAVLWSSSSHWILGVPYDMVQRARRNGGQAEIDLEDMVRINCNRLLYISHMAGLWLVAFTCFVLTGLASLGFFYSVEFAQAVFLMAFPMALVGLMALSTARLIEQNALRGEDLRKRMIRHRVQVQVLGVVSIFITAVWGMYQNLTIGAIGG